MPTILKKNVTQALVVLALLLAPVYALCAGDIITTLTIREKAGVTSTNYPLTFGHVFRKGDVPNGQKVNVVIGNTVLNTQFDKKSSWPDGSVRHAVISVLLPKVTANQDLLLALELGGVNSNVGEMTKQQILDTGIAAKINLTGLSGSGYSGDLTADLRAAIVNTPALDYWLKGTVCTEILVSQDLNPSLNAAWEVRVYPGSSYIRVSHAIENVNASTRGNIDYAIDITNVNRQEKIYSKGTFRHNNSSRWRKIFWQIEEPPEVEIHYALSYWVSTGMVPPYDTGLEIPEEVLAAEYSNWLSKDRDVMGNGSVSKAFGTTGGRPEIGLLPKWTAIYLLSMDSRAKKIMLGNGEVSGHIPIHYRENDDSKEFFNKFVSIDDRPSVDIKTVNSFKAIGTDATDWSPDRAHQGSLVYVPYLVTGDKYFLDEIYYWAAWNLIYDVYGRDGVGTDQNFKDSIGERNGSSGIIYDQMRGTAWALRSVADAVVLAPDDDLERIYFSNKLNNNIKWLYLGNVLASGHGLQAARVPRENGDGSWPRVFAPWMHDFLVTVLADICRKEALPGTQSNDLKKYLGSFTVERFNRPAEFPRYEAAGYTWPLSDVNKDYFSDGDWKKFWDNIALYRNVDKNNIATDFSKLDYGDSYAAISLGTIAFLIDIKGQEKAYDFLKNNLSYDNWANVNPTWAFKILPNKVKGLRVLK